MSAGAAGGSLLPPEATAVLSHLQASLSTRRALDPCLPALYGSAAELHGGQPPTATAAAALLLLLPPAGRECVCRSGAAAQPAAAAAPDCGNAGAHTTGGGQRAAGARGGVHLPAPVLCACCQSVLHALLPLGSAMLPPTPVLPAACPLSLQRHGSHWYYSIHSAGKQYRRHCRRPLADPAVEPSEHDSMDVEQPEETLLDEDELAGGHRCCRRRRCCYRCCCCRCRRTGGRVHLPVNHAPPSLFPATSGCPSFSTTPLELILVIGSLWCVGTLPHLIPSTTPLPPPRCSGTLLL